MRFLTAIMATLFSVSAFAVGLIEITVVPTDNYIFDGKTAACQRDSDMVQGPYATFKNTTITYTGDGEFHPMMIMLTLADSDLAGERYTSVYAGSNLDTAMYTSPMRDRDVRKTNCNLPFGGISFKDHVTTATIRGHVKIKGVEVLIDGTQNNLEGSVPVKLIYEKF